MRSSAARRWLVGVLATMGSRAYAQAPSDAAAPTSPQAPAPTSAQAPTPGGGCVETVERGPDGVSRAVSRTACGAPAGAASADAAKPDYVAVSFELGYAHLASNPMFADGVGSGIGLVIASGAWALDWTLLGYALPPPDALDSDKTSGTMLQSSLLARWRVSRLALGAGVSLTSTPVLAMNSADDPDMVDPHAERIIKVGPIFGGRLELSELVFLDARVFLPLYREQAPPFYVPSGAAMNGTTPVTIETDDRTATVFTVGLGVMLGR